jgi:predicted dehydrogenase
MKEEHPLRYGIIGCGMMGCEHIRNIESLPEGEIVALSDPFEESRNYARMALADASDVTVVEDHRDLLALPDVDAVVIASPNFTHAALLDDVFETDKHVLVEKPMCTTMEDCRRVVEGAARHPGVVWVGLEYRYMPPIAHFLRELRSGAVGDVKMLSIREHRYPFLPKVGHWNRFNRNTGGTLVEKCCHFFDLMNLAIPSLPARVFASGGQDVNHLEESYDGEVPDILDNAFVIVDYENGARAHLDLCMFAESSPNEQEISAVGPAGKLETNVPEGRMRVGTRKWKDHREFDCDPDARIEHAGFHHGASYLEHLGFIHAIRSGEEAEVTVVDGLRSVAIGLAAHRSIDEGRVVELSELGSI